MGCKQLTARTVIVLLAIFAVACLPLQAQGDRGAITGTVFDQLGAHLQNAKVSLTDESTHVLLKTSANNVGEFFFTSL